MRFGPTKHFSVKGCYHAMNFGGVDCLGNVEIWGSSAPKKCKIFAWLTLHNHLNTRDRLSRRGVIEEASCPFGCRTEEGLSHLLFLCPHTSFLWANLFGQMGNNSSCCYCVEYTVTKSQSVWQCNNLSKTTRGELFGHNNPLLTSLQAKGTSSSHQAMGRKHS
jgi:hypothetical protein